MTDGIIWSDEGFTGTAHLRRDQRNVSNQFRAVARTGEVATWDPDDLPVMEIPVDGADPILVTALLDVSSGLISWLFDEATSNAASDAGHMWWVESGFRVGDIRVVTL